MLSQQPGRNCQVIAQHAQLHLHSWLITGGVDYKLIICSSISLTTGYYRQPTSFGACAPSHRPPTPVLFSMMKRPVRASSCMHACCCACGSSLAVCWASFDSADHVSTCAPSHNVFYLLVSHDGLIVRYRVPPNKLAIFIPALPHVSSLPK